MIFNDLIVQYPKDIILKNKETGEITRYEIQDVPTEEVIQNSDTPITAKNLNQMQTDIQEKNSVITAFIGTNVTLSTTDLVRLSFSSKISTGSILELNNENGSVTVTGNDITKVKVSGVVMINMASSGVMNVWVHKNETEPIIRALLLMLQKTIILLCQ